MIRLTYKEQVTKTVYEQLEDTTFTIEQSYKQWWQNPRRGGGLRLTQVGDLNFRLARLEYHDHDLITKDKSYYSFVLDLDKKIKCPYYVDVRQSDKGHKPFIRLYDDRISMMLNLYGDLDSYLNSVRIKK